MFDHIRTFLPEIVSELMSKLKDCKERLMEIGPNLPTTDVEKQQLVWNIIS